MAKELIISTSRVNGYGGRVLTGGIDIIQYEKNPVLLYMHQRGFRFTEKDTPTPIGRMENIRLDGDRLIGTPVFDTDDEFAAKIANKWEKDFLRMASAGFEPIEFSTDVAYVLPGQTRATVTKCKLIEVSIVDIGSNDDALKLYNNGKLLELAAGEECDVMPLLLSAEKEPEIPEINNQNILKMDKILLSLGLTVGATEDQAVAAIVKLQADAGKVEKIELASITGIVDAAVSAKRITADKKDHFIALGKASGIEALNTTLELFKVTQKPTDVINLGGDKTVIELTKYSDASEAQLQELLKTDQPKYIALFKAEYGYEPKLD